MTAAVVARSLCRRRSREPQLRSTVAALTTPVSFDESDAGPTTSFSPTLLSISRSGLRLSSHWTFCHIVSSQRITLTLLCPSFSTAANDCLIRWVLWLQKVAFYINFISPKPLRYKKIQNTKCTKKYKLCTANKNPMLVTGVNKRNKQRRVHHTQTFKRHLKTFLLQQSFRLTL